MPSSNAQTFKTVYSFTSPDDHFAWTNSDGAGPTTTLVLSGNTLFGAAYRAGPNGFGTIFAVHTDGTGFTNLHSFTAPDATTGTNSDGAHPTGGMVLSGNTLYGTAYFGGTNDTGTVFALNTDGTAFTTLHSFTGPVYSTNIDGANPSADLLLSGNTLYGTCYRGGSNDSGTVFALNTDGTDFRVLHTFSPFSAFPTNSEGGGLFTGVILSGSTLYGAAYSGGSSGNGTVFALNTDGTGFTNLHSFSSSSDGAHPIGGLLLWGNILYGTAQQGGSSSNGTVFALNTDGTGFTNLHSFVSIDGAKPNGGLVLSGNTLYGTTWTTVFAVNTDGTGFTTLYSGAYSPYAGLTLSGNSLYGTEYWGGTGSGTVFSISFSPPLSLARYETNLVLSWPTKYAGFGYSGFTLQSTTNLSSPSWTANLPAPFVVNGHCMVTNPISGTQQFFRLSQ